MSQENENLKEELEETIKPLTDKIKTMEKELDEYKARERNEAVEENRWIPKNARLSGAIEI